MTQVPNSDGGGVASGDRETVADVTAEMRRWMPHACGDWADRIDRASRLGDDTLRDWFAGQALGPTLMSMANGLHSVQRGKTVVESAVADAYAVADAMLAERERRS